MSRFWAFRALVVASVVMPVLSLTPRTAAAHDVGVTSVARVFVDQMGERHYVLSIVDTGLPALTDSVGLLPPGCSATRGIVGTMAAPSTVPTLVFQCDRELALGDVVTLPWDLAGVVAVARWLDGTEASAYFRGRGGSVSIRMGELRAGAASRVNLAKRYSMLGGEHILLGIDHLLFVLGLLLLVRGVGPLVKTITAFTVAHSLTLGATVLGLLTVDRGAVEATIALSIVLLAREIVLGRKGRSSLVRRRPWLVALVFGLLHGFGFAGALGEIGLRSADIPLALLSFNLGVEAGQLAFVAAVLTLNSMVRRTMQTRVRRLEPALGYALGTVATLWFFDRLPAVWGG